MLEDPWMLSKRLTEPSVPTVMPSLEKLLDSEELSLCVEKIASLGELSSLHLDVEEPAADTVASEQDRFEVAEPKVVDTSPA